MNKIIIDTYKGVDILYNKDNGKLFFNFENKDFEVKYLFEAKEIIDEPIWEDCNLEGYYVTGVFEDEIRKTKATKKNIKTGLPCWSFDSYHCGDKTVYPKSTKNDDIYNKYEKQKLIISNEKFVLNEIIRELNK